MTRKKKKGRQPARREETDHSRTWLNHSGIALAAPLGVVYLIESLIFKTVQTSNIVGGFELSSALLSTASDAAFAIFITFVAAVLFSRPKKKTRIVAAIVFYLIMSYALIISAFSNGYFLATGSNLSWSTIEYWFYNMGITTEIIASEAASWRLAILGGQLLLIAACIVVPRLAKTRRWIDRRTPFSKKQTKQITIAAAVIFAVFLFMPTPKGRTMAAAQCIPVSIVEGLVRDTLLMSSAVEIADEDRLDGVLEFEKKPNAPRPNIVFIIFESLNWKSTDLYIPGLGATPFLAELAERGGTIVEHNYSIVPHTTKAIMPILCGIYPALQTKPIETIPGILPRRCLAHILGDEGYRSAFFQPAYAFEKRNVLVSNMGFEVYAGVKEMPREGFEKVSYFGSEDKIMIEPSMEWVDSVKDKGPFFLTYLTLSTHHNYITPQTFPYVDFGKEDKDWNNFLNAVRYIDDTIREIFEEFEQRGLLENTVFFMMGDHGEGFAEHARRQHDLVLWEEGVRSAALIYGPDLLPRSERIKGIRSNLDFVPTVCDLLGLELKNGSFVGQSLFKAVRDDRKLFYSCWFNRQCLAMREGPVKTIYHYGSQPMEVYDNYADPFEKDDLSNTGDYPESFLDERKQEMLRWKKTIDQQYAEWERGLTEGKVTETEPPIKNRLDARFGDAVEFVGYEAPKRAVAGQDIRLKYIFRGAGQLSSKDKLFVHVAHGRSLLNADHVPVSGTYPPQKWKEGEYVVDEHIVHIPGDWSGGDVRVYVGFWNSRTKQRLPVTSAEGKVDQSRLLVAEFPVEGRRRKSGFNLGMIRGKIKDWIGYEKPPVEHEIGAVFDDTVELVGVSRERMDVMLAGTVEMTYVFHAKQKIPRNWRLVVRLVRDDGFTIKGDHTPIRGLYRPKHWREGEYVVDKHKIHIDMYKSKVGHYTAWLGFAAGSRPVPVSGDGEFDKYNRVKIGEVTISPRDAKQ